MRGMTEEHPEAVITLPPPLGYKMQDGIPVIVPEQVRNSKKDIYMVCR